MEMRAAEDIDIGEDVTLPLAPLSYALHDSFLHSHCSTCFYPLPYSNPRHHHVLTFLYCSSFCSASHISSSELHLLHSSSSFSPTSADLRAALRLLHHSLPSSADRIFGLLTNRKKLMADEEISARVKDGTRVMAAARRIEMDGNRNVNENEAVLLEAALCLVLTNAVEVQDNEGRAIGIAVYGPNFSWINHSCSPNACYRFLFFPSYNSLPCGDESRPRIIHAGSKGGNGAQNNIELPKGYGEYGPRVIVRSIKRIRKGEEVTVAYTDLLQPMELRQSELWSKYRFICCCIRCGPSPLSYVDHALQEISASSLASSSLSSNQQHLRDQASRRLTDYIDEVITDFLTVGDPGPCCEKLEAILFSGLLDEQLDDGIGKSQLNFRLHPLHHLTLKAYTTLASAYKIRAGDLSALHPELGSHSLEVLSMSRISAAYSLLLAAVTYHLFCFEPSLIASVAQFWTNAGESLLALARSSAWDSLGEYRSPVLNFSSLAEHKCSKCLLPERLGVNVSLGQDHIEQEDFDRISNSFLDCISSLSRKVWGFLILGCCYLKMFKGLLGFSWLGKPLNDFEAGITCKDMDFSHCTEESIFGFGAQENINKFRIHIFQLAVHCLHYGGILAGICYGVVDRFEKVFGETEQNIGGKEKMLEEKGEGEVATEKRDGISN